MLKLGRAQGVAMAAALSRDIPITEYEPKNQNGDYWKWKCH
jgi:crossover junction endodeoxyribonuclease RuvC